MKSVRKTGCWTVFAFVIALIALIYLSTPFRQERNASSDGQIRGNIVILGGDVRLDQDEVVSGNLLIVGKRPGIGRTDWRKSCCHRR